MRISANLGAKLRSRPTVDVDVDSFAVLFFFIGSLRVAGGSSSFSVAYAAGLRKILRLVRIHDLRRYTLKQVSIF